MHRSLGGCLRQNIAGNTDSVLSTAENMAMRDFECKNVLNIYLSTKNCFELWIELLYEAFTRNLPFLLLFLIFLSPFSTPNPKGTFFF